MNSIRFSGVHTFSFQFPDVKEVPNPFKHYVAFQPEVMERYAVNLIADRLAATGGRQERDVLVVSRPGLLNDGNDETQGSPNCIMVISNDKPSTLERHEVEQGNTVLSEGQDADLYNRAAFQVLRQYPKRKQSGRGQLLQLPSQLSYKWAMYQLRNQFLKRAQAVKVIINRIDRDDPKTRKENRSIPALLFNVQQLGI